MITVKQVEKAVQLVREVAGDPEAAHLTEDDLYLTVLRAIAQGTAEDPVKMASLAIETQKIEFPRWCA